MAIKILSVVETRPSLIKAAAICKAIQRFNRVSQHDSIRHILIYIGQANDSRGFDLYFNDLDPPKPDLFLSVSTSVGRLDKTAQITERLAGVILRERPAVVLIIGDDDSALECALVTKKTGYRASDAGQVIVPALAHVGAGFRSVDRSIPRDVNRIAVDLLSDYLFTTEESANRNLLQEGIPGDNIHFVGSVAIDTLLRHRARMMKSSILKDLQLSDGPGTRPFALIVLQHLSAADPKDKLSGLQQVFSEIARRMPVVFPADPATLKRIHEADLGDYFIDHFFDGPEPWDARVRIRLVPPLGYLDFVRLMAAAKVVLTDSSSVQEETRVLGVPCITLSDYRVRPVTLKDGANVLAGTDPERILDAFFKATQSMFARPERPNGWDGRAAQRIVDILWRDFGPGEPRKKPLVSGQERGASPAGV